jgi:hypothetical protein
LFAPRAALGRSASLLGEAGDLRGRGLLACRRRHSAARLLSSAALAAAQLIRVGAPLGHDLLLLVAAKRVVRVRGA